MKTQQTEKSRETRRHKKPSEYLEGDEARGRFDRAMKSLFNVPKAKVAVRKPAGKRFSRKRSDRG
jgi:hypothetical protein